MPTPTATRTRLNVHPLEGREVPAVLIDLGTAGAEGTAAGAILRQSGPVSGADRFDTFLRLKGERTEAGYNSDARPLFMDQQGGRGTTHALKLADVPQVVVNGVSYREFLLDVDQRSRSATITLTELRLFTGNNRNLWGYNGEARTLGGRAAAFDLDQGGDVSVRLNGNLNGGRAPGDMVVLVPSSRFGGDRYVFLFSRFTGANGGAEEWGVRKSPPATQTGSLSGSVFADLNGNGTWEPNGTPSDPTQEYGLAGVTVQIQFTNAQGQAVTQSTTTDDNGQFTFTGLAAGTYTITIIDPAGFMPGAVTQYTVTLTAGMNGTGYNFGELPDLGAN